MSFLQVNNVVKLYGQDQGQVAALRGVSFDLETGEFVSIMGPSGSGKSTLLAVMGGLNTPSSGSYQVDGLNVYSLTPDQRADFRREYLGFIFQNYHLMPFLTLLENVMLPLAIKKMPKMEKREMAAQALARVGLAGKEGRLPGQVSGGEQERAAIARALVNRPPLLLADEPTGNLDAATGQEIMNLLGTLGEEGMTIVMVTHNPTYAAYGHRTMHLADGCLVSDQVRV